MSQFKKNHHLLEKNVSDLIKNGLEIISGNFYIKGSNDKHLQSMLLESFLLRSCSYWEYFLEKEIILLIKKKSESFKNYYDLPKSTIINVNLIRAILFGDKYKDFHDLKSLRSFFYKIIHPSVNPFESITNEQIQKLNFTYNLRNYLSHYSTYSKRKLQMSYNSKYGYTKFVEPGIFLLKNNGRYFESLLHNFVLISIVMRRKLGV
ncbi:MAG: hypothetical protein QXG00_07725 [Candidatus Woesearchaeota archaeon]